MGVVDSLSATSEPSYVLAFTLFNAAVVVYVVAIHMRRVKRKQMKEKPGRRPN